MYVYIFFIEETFSKDVRDSVYPWLIYAGIIVVGAGVLGYQAIQVIQDKMPWRTFFITYKVIDLIFAGINVIGIVVVQDELEFDLWLDDPADHWKDIALVVITGLDLTFDPIELVCVCCCLRNE